MKEHLYKVVLSKRKKVEKESDQACRYNYKIYKK